MHPFQRLIRLADIVAPLFLDRFSTQTARALDAHRPQPARSAAPGPRHTLAVGTFGNRTRYLRGEFLEFADRLGSQAKTILISHLQQSQRFLVLDSENLAQQLQGADYVVTGEIAQFGRKEVGALPRFGVLGRGKRQIAYAQVSLNIVDIHTAEVVRSVQGAGEYPLSNREVVGFGGSDDATLSGKVLDLAMRDAVDRLAEIVDAGQPTALPALPEAVR